MIDRHIYKAKRTDGGEWVGGFYFCMVHDDGRHVHHFIMPLGADLSLGTPIEKIQVEVNPKTVCQYTGLTDKNGKKIFEGDVVEEGGDVGIVEFGKYGNGFHYGFYIKWLTCPHLRPEFSFWNSRAERIGNVFDDQEFLKGYGVIEK